MVWGKCYNEKIVHSVARRLVQMTDSVRKWLGILEDHGYEAYIVGGAVRDKILGKEPSDQDVVTSAKPEAVLEIARRQGFSVVENLGHNFGVAVVIVDGVPIETAAFRSEAYGADSHRPSSVWYASSLEEDVSRRDFTVNALAMDVRGKIYDYVGGVDDIRHKRLRTVGDAGTRFQEDALRMFRACRFTGQLGFIPDEDILVGMTKAFPRVNGLSLERVRHELERLLVTPYAAKGLDILVQSGLAECSCRRKKNGAYESVPILPELFHLTQTPQSKPFHMHDAWYHTLAVVQNTPPELTVRLAALFHDAAKGLPGIRGFHHGRYTDYGHAEASREMAETALARLGMRPAMVRRVGWLVAGHMKFHDYAVSAESSLMRWLRLEARSGLFRRTADLVEAMTQLKQVAKADVIGCGYSKEGADNTENFGNFLIELAADMPIGTRDLRYGPEVVALCGSRTGACLQNLLSRVQGGGLENEAGELYAAAQRWLRRQERHEGEPYVGAE